jgi:hypothetical protein
MASNKFPEPNSHKYKAEKEANEKKKVEKVITGNVKVKEQSKVRKLTGSLISEDASSVKSYIVTDVFIPAVKKLVSDIVKDGIEMLLYGGTRPKDRPSNGYRANYVSYNKYSDRRDERYVRTDSSTRQRLDYGDVYFENRGDAEEVLDQMSDMLDRYDMVSVADLYDAVGLTCPHTWNKYGWTNLRDAKVVRTSEGYTIKLPRALPLD